MEQKFMLQNLNFDKSGYQKQYYKVFEISLYRVLPDCVISHKSSDFWWEMKKKFFRGSGLLFQVNTMKKYIQYYINILAALFNLFSKQKTHIKKITTCIFKNGGNTNRNIGHYFSTILKSQ